MDETEMVFEIAKLAGTVVGAIFVAGYWNWKKYENEQYQYLDEAYNEILKTYFDHPEFGQLESTSRYAEAFKDTALQQYHYFSMRVHTFLETIFDLSNRKILPSKRRIPDVWEHIFRHHANLHSAWLRKHQNLHEPGYMRLVLGEKIA